MRNLINTLIITMPLALGLGACAPEVDEPAEHELRSIPVDFCGGIAGIPCPQGFMCIDDPNDDCDPEQGGADCGGICVECDYDDRTRTYVSDDPEQCQVIRFLCVEGTQPFFDECGCGCEII